MAIELSVVIPTYRRPKSLVEALQSVLSQRGVRLDVLVVDDCPSGSAESVVRAIDDPRVRYLRHSQHSNGRPAIVRNYAWPLTQGEVLHFMDDDDIVPDGWYAAALGELKRSPNVGIVFGRIEPFGEPSEALQNDRRLFARSAVTASRLQRLGAPWVFAANLLFLDLLFNGGSCVMRRQCLVAVGGYNTNVEIMEDVDLLARATRLFGAKYLDCVSLHYRIWPSLMHRSASVPEIMERSYVTAQANYRREFGSMDFYALKIAARLLLRWFKPRAIPAH
jgi:glycosyltransferase involved in cell wall biosynthesis